MFSSFSKLLPTNVTISTPDFLKNHNPLSQNSNSAASNGHSAAATTTSAGTTPTTATTVATTQQSQARRDAPSRTNTGETDATGASHDVTTESPRKDGKK